MLSSVLSAEDKKRKEKENQEKKKPQPKGRKITLISDNKISEDKHFYFKTWPNEMREILTGLNLRLTVDFVYNFDFLISRPADEV